METEEGGMKAIENLNGTMLPDAEQEKPLVVAVSKNHEGPSLSTMKMNVKNVPPTLTADALRSLFTPYGLVLKAKIFHKPLVSHDGTREGVVVSLFIQHIYLITVGKMYINLSFKNQIEYEYHI